MVYHGDAVAEAQRLVDVVTHVQHRSVECLEQAGKVLLKYAFQVRIQGGKRLVEHEDVGFRRQHARQGHALLLSAGKLAGVALAESLQTETAQLVCYLGIALLLWGFAVDARSHVLGNGEVGEQHVVLEQQSGFALLRREVHAGLLARFALEEHLVIHDDTAFIGCFDAGNAAHGKAFAAAGFAKEAQGLVLSIDVHIQGEGGEVLLYVHGEAHFSAPLRYLVVRLLQRLMNRITRKLKPITMAVQNQATPSLPFIHSK